MKRADSLSLVIVGSRIFALSLSVLMKELKYGFLQEANFNIHTACHFDTVIASGLKDGNVGFTCEVCSRMDVKSIGVNVLFPWIDAIVFDTGAMGVGVPNSRTRGGGF